MKLSCSWNVLYRSSFCTVNGSDPKEVYAVPSNRMSTNGNSFPISPRLSSLFVKPTIKLFDMLEPSTEFHSPMPDLMFSRIEYVERLKARYAVVNVDRPMPADEELDG